MSYVIIDEDVIERKFHDYVIYFLYYNSHHQRERSRIFLMEQCESLILSCGVEHSCETILFFVRQQMIRLPISGDEKCFFPCDRRRDYCDHRQDNNCDLVLK